ncbi:hypothetical protein [Anabaena sp. CA = ATCC 33047]|nr:hypothetical protein [Anabaena sp. CA = ATCC 33047]
MKLVHKIPVCGYEIGDRWYQLTIHSHFDISHVNYMMFAENS